ncbi:NADP-dependent oxidoreductase [Lacticaseibacillus yichunensis]|uniref:NADP-dependent oxidoreductase n=1 Tax=Lacticaseibacillus yichunensis TaxID=2486015 RepID=A0ABW4CPW2_9LACO|nr:NADP-dependent oxidoreductase [Lacticaseibacillus yichunensis]
MNRYGFSTFGAPSVFETIQAKALPPIAGVVQITVQGVGLNPYDAALRRGEQAKIRPLTFPIVPGTDVVGTVTAIGKGVTEFALGDTVINYRPIGGYSEVVNASVSKVAKMPDAMPLTQAAGLAQAGVAALAALRQVNLHPGATLAIQGASGGVGSLLVQLARTAGLHVIALASRPNLPLLKKLGADLALATDDLGKIADVFGTADAVINATGGGHELATSIELVKPDGKLLTTAWVDVDLSTRPHVTRLQLGTIKVDNGALLHELVDTVAAGALSVPLADVLPFDLAGVIRGHELLETRHAPGKIVLVK